MKLVSDDGSLGPLAPEKVFEKVQFRGEACLSVSATHRQSEKAVFLFTLVTVFKAPYLVLMVMY